MDQKKVCEKCGGKGVYMILPEAFAQAGLYHLAQLPPKAKLCPCLTERMAKLEKVAEVAKDAVDDNPCWFDHNGFCQEHAGRPPCYQSELKAALAALEGDENDAQRTR